MFPLVAITSTWVKRVGGVERGTVITRVAFADVWAELRTTLNGLTVASTDENEVRVERITVPENPSREVSVRVEFAVWPAWRLRK